MKKNIENFREQLTECPWCGSDLSKKWGSHLVKGFKTVACKKCGLVYVQNRLNKHGLKRYYEKYLSGVHQVDSSSNERRKLMYGMEFDLINSYCAKGSVLDVGCSGGYFLDHFKEAGFDCYGVEFGEEAAKEAGKKYKVYLGEFPFIKFDKKFDLVILRGVIEHIPFPKSYLEMAAKVLNKKGFVFLTSVPNTDSFCAKLFEEKWNQHEPEAHIVNFKPAHFDDFFASKGFKKVAREFFYEKTPYANIEEDVLKVAKAIRMKKAGKEINFSSPAFYGNLMSLIYQKES